MSKNRLSVVFTKHGLLLFSCLQKFSLYHFAEHLFFRHLSCCLDELVHRNIQHGLHLLQSPVGRACASHLGWNCSLQTPHWTRTVSRRAGCLQIHTSGMISSPVRKRDGLFPFMTGGIVMNPCSMQCSRWAHMLFWSQAQCSGFLPAHNANAFAMANKPQAVFPF